MSSRETPMLFQDLMVAADRVAGIREYPSLDFLPRPPHHQAVSTRPMPVYEDDLYTLKRTACVVEESGSPGLSKKIRFAPQPPREVLTDQIPPEARIPRYNWLRELQNNLAEESMNRNGKQINNSGLVISPYFSQARSVRLGECLSRMTYDDEYVDIGDCFKSEQGVSVELIDVVHDYRVVTDLSTLHDTNEMKLPRETVRSKTASGTNRSLDLKSKSKSSAFKRQLDDAVVSNRSRRLLTSVSNHLVATTHRNTKPDLHAHELRSFHRPRMSSSLKARPWAITVKGEKAKASAATSACRSLSLANANVDLNLASGEFILIEYIEETPPVVLNFGMASIILNYERARDSNGDQEDKRQKSVNSRHLKVDSYYRLPRHVKLLMDSKDMKQIFEVDGNAKLAVGEPYLLETDEEFPFLGDLAEGERIQSLKNELFRSPLFSHSPRPNDFLLTRTKIGKDCLMYSIRPIRRLFISGQVEPLDVVPRPSRALTTTQENFFLLAAARLFATSPSGLDWADLCKELIKSSYSKAKALEGVLGRISQNMRSYDPDSMTRARTTKWVPNKDLLAEDWERRLSPKDVCLQESAVAAEYRMNLMGLELVDLNKLWRWLTLNSDLLAFRKERAVKVILQAEGAKDVKTKAALQQLKRVLVREMKDLEAKLEVGRFISRYLLSCPWSTTEAFKDRKSHLLDIRDPYDPSGRIRGFQYVKKRVDNIAKPSEKLQGTKSDLRQLTKKEAIDLLVDLCAGSIPRETIDKMGRWERVREIATLSKKAKMMGAGKELHKFARNTKSIYSGTDSDDFAKFKEDCVALWNNQKAMLSSTGGSGDDEDDDDDDDGGDDFEEDIEKEIEEEAQRRRAEKQSGSLEPEDTVASLLADISGPRRPQIRIDGTEITSSANRVAAARPQKVVKRTTRIIKEDGTESVEIEYIVSPRELERVINDEAKRKARMESLSKRSKTFEVDFLEDYSALGATGNLNLKISRSSKLTGMSRGGEDYRDDLMEKKLGSSRRTKDQPRDYRMPHIAFAVKLESVLMDTWNRKTAPAFRYPVDGNLVLGYYDKIKSPMCLSDMREKVARCQYITRRAFFEDLQLMAANAATFNGPDSQLAKDAESLLKFGESALEHDRKLLGAHKDAFGILEEAIIDKFEYLKRPVPGRKPAVVPVPVVAPTQVIRAVDVLPVAPAILAAPQNTASAAISTTEGVAQPSVPFASAAGLLSAQGASCNFDKDGDSSSGDEEVLEEG